jgi:hypothetical protein
MIILNDQKEILNKVVGNLKIVADCLWWRNTFKRNW